MKESLKGSKKLLCFFLLFEMKAQARSCFDSQHRDREQNLRGGE
jgi:hypothetical protein